MEWLFLVAWNAEAREETEVENVEDLWLQYFTGNKTIESHKVVAHNEGQAWRTGWEWAEKQGYGILDPITHDVLSIPEVNAKRESLREILEPKGIKIKK
jgi:hypothetical protein